MIYTVGSKQAYLREYLKNGRVVKAGRKRGTPGGCAFRTREDAERHLDELRLQGHKDYQVFGLLADWDRDTRSSADHWWHDLLRDAEVVVLEPDEQPG